jgi:hypothetical protein
MSKELTVLGRPETDHAQAECYTCGSREDFGSRQKEASSQGQADGVYSDFNCSEYPADKQDELTQLAVLDPEAMTVLQSFGKDFLKSSFNSTSPSRTDFARHELISSLLCVGTKRYQDGALKGPTIR